MGIYMAKTVDVTVDTRCVLWYNSDSKLKQDNTEKNINRGRKSQMNNVECGGNMIRKVISKMQEVE